MWLVALAGRGARDAAQAGLRWSKSMGGRARSSQLKVLGVGGKRVSIREHIDRSVL